jgi:hypothetical protein
MLSSRTLSLTWSLTATATATDFPGEENVHVAVNDQVNDNDNAKKPSLDGT